MKRADYIYQRFYDELKAIDDVSENLGRYIVQDDFVQDIFDVCEKVSYIGINVPKIKDPQSTHVQASFQYEDIDNAIFYVTTFSTKYSDIAIPELLSTIRQLHRYAYSENKAGSVSGVVWNDSHSIGSYNNFSELPEDIWQRFSEYAEECICNGHSPDSAHSSVFNAE